MQARRPRCAYHIDCSSRFLPYGAIPSRQLPSVLGNPRKRALSTRALGFGDLRDRIGFWVFDVRPSSTKAGVYHKLNGSATCPAEISHSIENSEAPGGTGGAYGPPRARHSFGVQQTPSPVQDSHSSDRAQMSGHLVSDGSYSRGAHPLASDWIGANLTFPYPLRGKKVM